MNIQAWLTSASTIIGHDRLIDLEILLSNRLNRNRAYLHGFSDSVISDTVLLQLNDDLDKLQQGFPLAYLLCQQSFWDMELKVNQHTLIPRSDTETLVEIIQIIYPNDKNIKILDLGTGSGAIAIALSRIFKNAHIFASDISKETLKVTQENINQWAKTPITLIESDWFDEIVDIDFDCIVSNPPYIAPNDHHLKDLQFEPQIALVSEDAGLKDIKHIIQNAPKYLAQNGGLFIEHGYDQGKSVDQLFSNNEFFQTSINQKDLSNQPRVSYSFLKS